MPPECCTLDTLIDRARTTALAPCSAGRVTGVRSGLIQARGLNVGVGAICRIARAGRELLAEVVSLDTSSHQLAPWGCLQGLTPGARISWVPEGLPLPDPRSIMGMVVNALGQPVDGARLPTPGRSVLDRSTPRLSARRGIEQPLVTRVASVDGLLTIGRGQRVGIFAGSGVGKSTLVSALTHHAEADAVVVALVGERGREVQEFHASLSADSRRRTIVVAATSDVPAALRILAPSTAIALAEDLRDQGQEVLLVVDSITRFALAAREVGITAGEPPSARGFPPSVFARMPQLLERLGRFEVGSITALLTVLVEGDRIEDDPVADALRGLLDGHILLSRELAERGHYPSVDIPASISRNMRDVVTPAHRDAAARVRVLCSALRRAEELREIGAYHPGADATLDEAIEKADALRAFLTQAEDEARGFKDTQLDIARLALPTSEGSRR